MYAYTHILQTYISYIINLLFLISILKRVLCCFTVYRDKISIRLIKKALTIILKYVIGCGLLICIFIRFKRQNNNL